MAEITSKHYLYGVIMMMFFVTGGVVLLSSLKTYNPAMDGDRDIGEFNQTFNKLTDVSNDVTTLQENIQADPDWGLFGALNALIQSSWNSLILIVQSFSVLQTAFTGMSTLFGVPSWIVGVIGLMITVTLVFAIYSLVFQKDA